MRNLLATFLVLLATAQPAMCCCPELESPRCCSCCGDEHAGRGATVHRTCNCQGQAGGCGCEGHLCASTQPTPVTREKSNQWSNESVTTAFQPASAVSLLPTATTLCIAENTPCIHLAKCRPHLLLGHLVI